MADSSLTVHVGTRRSPLALKQTEMVVAGLQKAYPDHRFEVHAMATAGDKDKISPLPNLGKGLWTSELEALLVSRELDLVVHSLKDMPTSLPEGCVLGCVTGREDRRDVVVFKKQQQQSGDESSSASSTTYKSLAELPSGAVVGTSSVRRAAQLRRRFPSLVFRDVRGNIDTRLRKLDDPEGEYDCIILAAAGLLRMDLGARIGQFLDSNTEGGGVLHAVGQGALGIEARAGDERVLGMLKAVEDTPTMMATVAERSVMRTLEGGCSVPIGVETSWVDGEEETGGGKKLCLKAVVVSLDGNQAVESERIATVASLEEADAFGKDVAQRLVDLGAQKILDAITQVKSVEAGAAS